MTNPVAGLGVPVLDAREREALLAALEGQDDDANEDGGKPGDGEPWRSPGRTLTPRESRPRMIS
ncbi:MAG: hypothetical protein ABIT01_04595 [Thermoanaerobaculia bacterium]